MTDEKKKDITPETSEKKEPVAIPAAGDKPAEEGGGDKSALTDSPASPDESQGGKDEKKKEEKKSETKKNTAPATDSTDDSAEGEKVEVPEKFKKLVEQVETMSVLELHELVKILEKKFGVSAATIAVAGPANGGGAEEEEKTEFNVELISDGGAKIPTMKVVKEILGLGLKEAKDLVEGVPSVLKEGVKKEEAEEMKKKIEEAGGKVELK